MSIGTGAALKSNSRLLSGGSMKPYSILLEGSLVMTGEVIESGYVWQGWPCRQQYTMEEYLDTMEKKLRSVSALHDAHADSRMTSEASDMAEMPKFLKHQFLLKNNIARTMDFNTNDVFDIENQHVFSIDESIHKVETELR
jgi:hypothetical protein